jgi:hypothetical protein
MAPHPRRLNLNTFCCKISGFIMKMIKWR